MLFYGWSCLHTRESGAPEAVRPSPVINRQTCFHSSPDGEEANISRGREAMDKLRTPSRRRALQRRASASRARWPGTERQAGECYCWVAYASPKMTAAANPQRSGALRWSETGGEPCKCAAVGDGLQQGC